MDVKIIADKENRKLFALLSGDIDHHTSKHIREEVDSAVKLHDPKTLVLDFSAVTFMDSSGIGLVMGRYKLMKELSGELIIANTPMYIKKVMMLAGMDLLCKIAEIPQPDKTDKKESENK